MAIVPLLRDAEIVGNHFREDVEKQAFADLEVGNRLEIELEPGNPHDQFAVKVLAGGAHIGYIPKIMSAVCHLLRDDMKVTIEVTKVEQTEGKKGAAGRRHVYMSLGCEV